ncbi:hypothetical protein NPX13_g5172 [Xylaria arbuscula]|uniref:Uncharacterized protein n=1 Tax=Xylaria arbuscula TaxID=114810 RepID=A0A9W8NEM8_9PEZI|nr:hypothetical protein NPX13_g5172 [Xylaria arbuscula]
MAPASPSSPATPTTRPSEHQTPPRLLYQEEEAGSRGGRLWGNGGFGNESSTVGDRNTVDQRGAHNRQATKGDRNRTLQNYYGNLPLQKPFLRDSSSTAWHMPAAIGLVAIAGISYLLLKLFGRDQ